MTQNRLLRALIGGLLALAILPAAAVAVAPPSFRDGRDLHVESVKQLGDRLFALTLRTPLLTAPTNVRILLPAGYDASGKRRYPVLYLYHGTSGGAGDWTAQPGRAQDITAGLPLIVVMPDAGVNSNGGSWFTNWVNGGRFGPPEWETWHVDRLIPWIDRSLRTVAQRRGRAIAGLSQGGFGAMSYAARHPDLFSAAASFSGAVDIAANPLVADPLVTPIINATEVGLNGVPPNTFFGDRASNEVNWAAHDPATLAGNLRAMRLYAWTGDGRPGPLDGAGYSPAAALIEAGVHELSDLFHGELLKRSIPIDYRDYGPGTHAWPYWERDLRELMGPLMSDFDHPDPAPATVDYQSDSAHWAEWGWNVAIDRPAREFSRLSNAGRTGFTLTGSGIATVVTPGFYRPGSTARVSMVGSGPRTLQRVRADKKGRLHLLVALGPGNPAQQSTAGATTHEYSTAVRVAAAK
jgi:S-formylglutathione hydrolase FrmB